MKQPKDKSTVDIEDIFLWPDNSVYYYRYEVNEELIRFKGDDYRLNSAESAGMMGSAPCERRLLKG